ncbi:response regulator transcription factor [Candidatus Woesearchaeota archaeon]|nr:response regulator transcription factor [Candidatus Woesearchaeota archaeon]
MLRKKILVVDDEFAINFLLEMVLKESYDLVTAKDGMEAIERMSDDIDLVILDLMMPKIDGFAFLEKLRSSLRTKDMPVIILSAKHSKDDVDRARRLGVIDYVPKPFEPELLRNKVDSFFAGRLDVKR